jgi:hypothetical protein
MKWTLAEIVGMLSLSMDLVFASRRDADALKVVCPEP